MSAVYQVRHAGGTPAYKGLMGFAIPEYMLRGTNTAVNEAFDNMVRIGATWLRTDVYWNAAEQVQGTYSWTNIDRITAACALRGIKVVLCAHSMPPWARPNGAADPDVTGPVTTTQRNAYCAFVAAVAVRYPDAVIEIWNEPNLDQFWAPTPNVDDYRVLLKQAYLAIKAANPRTFVLGICTGGSVDALDIQAVTFATGVFASGGVNYMDAISHHPYGRNGVVGGSMREIQSLMSAAAAAGRPHMQVWGTECACATGGNATVVLTEDVHARSAIEFWRYWRENNARGVLFWFTLNDGPLASPEPWRYAPIRGDGTDKPIVRVMQALAAATSEPAFTDASWGVVR